MRNDNINVYICFFFIFGFYSKELLFFSLYLIRNWILEIVMKFIFFGEKMLEELNEYLRVFKCLVLGGNLL